MEHSGWAIGVRGTRMIPNKMRGESVRQSSYEEVAAYFGQLRNGTL